MIMMIMIMTVLSMGGYKRRLFCGMFMLFVLMTRHGAIVWTTLAFSIIWNEIVRVRKLICSRYIVLQFVVPTVCTVVTLIVLLTATTVQVVVGQVMRVHGRSKELNQKVWRGR